MGIQHGPTAPRSPWQNGYVERLIGPIRRECLDHIIGRGETHLPRVVFEYTRSYYATRTHLALRKDYPEPRPTEVDGRIVRTAMLGGLHHRYARI